MMWGKRRIRSSLAVILGKYDLMRIKDDCSLLPIG